MATAPKQKNETEEKPCCGLVMPISSIDGCSEQHWLEVKAIITEAVESAGFKANLVSQSEEIGVIQKRIVQNLYDNPIIICDVSGKNPNVMFELGMRLAFDKPTIIIKDDKTNYSFDTSPIEHLEYPRDLRFNKIVNFKETLQERLIATINKSESDPEYSTFLKHFGTFTVAKLDTKVVSKEDFIIEELKEMRKIISAPQKNREKNSLDSILSMAAKNTLALETEAVYAEELKSGNLQNFIKESTTHSDIKLFLIDKLLERNILEKLNVEKGIFTFLFDKFYDQTIEVYQETKFDAIKAALRQK